MCFNNLFSCELATKNNCHVEGYPCFISCLIPNFQTKRASWSKNGKHMVSCTNYKFVNSDTPCHRTTTSIYTFHVDLLGIYMYISIICLRQKMVRNGNVPMDLIRQHLFLQKLST